MTPTERLHVVETSLRDASCVLAGVNGPTQVLGVSKDLHTLAGVVQRVIQQLQTPATPLECSECDGTGIVLQPITDELLRELYPVGARVEPSTPQPYLIRVRGAPSRVALCGCIRREMARADD